MEIFLLSVTYSFLFVDGYNTMERIFVAFSRLQTCLFKEDHTLPKHSALISKWLKRKAQVGAVSITATV